MPIITDRDAIESVIARRVEETVVRESLREKLASGRILTIKMGFDPTAPDIHLGHAIGLRKMQEFMEMGHRAVMIVGDATTLIGDPSGKSKTRPALTPEEIEANAQTYLEQAGKVLDIGRLEVRRNSEWFSRMGIGEVLALARHFTVARMIERDDFEKRLKAGSDIGLHELLYPMMQAYDSVMVKADIEIGGTDQRFNILAGRELQRKMGQEPQDAMFLGPILVGLDGVRKMSKSLGNYIGVMEAPEEMYGKTMSLPDEAVWDWFRMVTEAPELEVQEMRIACERGEMNPRDAKARLAREVVAAYYGPDRAIAAEAHFDRTVRHKEAPEEMEELALPAGGHLLVDVLAVSGLVASKGEARRAIEQGGVRVDGRPAEGIGQSLTVGPEPIVVQKGKRHYRRLVSA